MSVPIAPSINHDHVGGAAQHYVDLDHCLKLEEAVLTENVELQASHSENVDAVALALSVVKLESRTLAHRRLFAVIGPVFVVAEL